MEKEGFRARLRRFFEDIGLIYVHPFVRRARQRRNSEHEIMKKARSHAEIARTAESLARFHSKRGELDKAESYYRQAGRAYRRIKEIYGVDIQGVKARQDKISEAVMHLAKRKQNPGLAIASFACFILGLMIIAPTITGNYIFGLESEYSLSFSFVLFILGIIGLVIFYLRKR
jgi:hypothetical protein